MKAKHNVILILVSSKWLIPYSGDSSKFLISFVHFSFPEFQVFSHYLVAKLHLNHCKASPCVSSFSFFLSSFYYRSSSWRLYMVVREGFLSFFICSSRFLLKLWSAKLHSKINMVLNTCCFWGVQVFFIWNSEMQFFLPYLLWWCYVTLDNFLHVSWFICCQEWGILNPSLFSSFKRSFRPINFFVGVILCQISPKAFP